MRHPIRRYNQAPGLAGELLAGLSGFRQTAFAGTAPHGPGLFSYCALLKERLAAVRLERPVLGVVLSGAKEIWLGDCFERMGPGATFVLPAQTDFDIVNEVDGVTGFYQSLILEIAPEDVPDLRSLPSEVALASHYTVPLTAELVEALLHAARAIAAGPPSDTIRRARIAELLAILHGVPSAASLFQLCVSERVARILRGDLDSPWTAARMARRLYMSESTLRRRLASEATSFSGVVRRERMAAARRLIAAGAGSGEAALAVGYASRAHFARAFRAAFGSNPTDHRA
jgi:AraC-like DNA-binding protein